MDIARDSTMYLTNVECVFRFKTGNFMIVHENISQGCSKKCGIFKYFDTSSGF